MLPTSITTRKAPRFIDRAMLAVALVRRGERGRARFASVFVWQDVWCASALVFHVELLCAHCKDSYERLQGHPQESSFG